MARPSVILDHLGRPIERRTLTEEVAGASVTGVRSILSTHPATGISPERMASILREAETPGGASDYLELAEEMEERYLHYLGVLQTRRRAVVQIGVEILPASDSPADAAVADTVREFFDRPTLELELFDVLDAVGKGFSVSEIVWETSERQWMPRQLLHRLPQWFDFDRDTGARLQRRGHAGGQRRRLGVQEERNGGAVDPQGVQALPPRLGGEGRADRRPGDAQELRPEGHLRIRQAPRHGRRHPEQRGPRVRPPSAGCAAGLPAVLPQGAPAPHHLPGHRARPSSSRHSTRSASSSISARCAFVASAVTLAGSFARRSRFGRGRWRPGGFGSGRPNAFASSSLACRRVSSFEERTPQRASSSPRYSSSSSPARVLATWIERTCAAVIGRSEITASPTASRAAPSPAIPARATTAAPGTPPPAAPPAAPRGAAPPPARPAP